MIRVPARAGQRCASRPTRKTTAIIDDRLGQGGPDRQSGRHRSYLQDSCRRERLVVHRGRSRRAPSSPGTSGRPPPLRRGHRPSRATVARERTPAGGRRDDPSACVHAMLVRAAHSGRSRHGARSWTCSGTDLISSRLYARLEDESDRQGSVPSSLNRKTRRDRHTSPGPDRPDRHRHRSLRLEVHHRAADRRSRCAGPPADRMFTVAPGH